MSKLSSEERGIVLDIIDTCRTDPGDALEAEETEELQEIFGEQQDLKQLEDKIKNHRSLNSEEREKLADILSLIAWVTTLDRSEIEMKDDGTIKAKHEDPENFIPLTADILKVADSLDIRDSVEEGLRNAVEAEEKPSEVE